jgi:hypothetical protein
MTFGEAAKTSARRRPAREESDDIEAPEEAPLPCDPCDPEDTLEEGTASVEDEKGGGSSLVTSLVMSVAVKKLQRKKIEQVVCARRRVSIRACALWAAKREELSSFFACESVRWVCFSNMEKGLHSQNQKISVLWRAC